jgi:hypothetical protein
VEKWAETRKNSIKSREITKICGRTIGEENGALSPPIQLLSIENKTVIFAYIFP